MLDQLRTGERRVGVKQCTKAVKEGRALRAFVAEDADTRLTEPFVALCQTRDVEIVSVSTMSKLGESCGIAVGSAVAVQLK